MNYSTAILGAIAIPPSLAALVWILLFKEVPKYLFDTVAVKLFLLLFTAVLIYKAVLVIRRRCVPCSMGYFGLLLAMLQALLWYGFHFSGTAAVGAGEQITEFTSVDSGIFFRSSALPIKVLEVLQSPESIKVVLDGVERSVRTGSQVEIGGNIYSLAGVEEAPLLSIETKGGDLVDEGYVKVTGGQYIMLGRLPHRFYIKPVQGKQDPRYRIKVVRDKLTLVDADAGPGEKIYFDGHYVSCSKGAPWARIVVQKKQSVLPLMAGIIFILVGTTLRIRRARSQH